MPDMNRIYIPVLIFALWLAAASCKKQEVQEASEMHVLQQSSSLVPQTYKLSYGDSVFYLMSNDYVVAPIMAKAGKYKAYPSNLNIDSVTGKITVSLNGNDKAQSQTGMRYNITFTSTLGEKFTTSIVLAGITYRDKIYYSTLNDSIALPIYNGSLSKPLPGGTYKSSNKKLAINASNGKINLKQSIRNGFFSDDLENKEWRQVTISYKTNDKSTSDKNCLNLIIYKYPSVTHIPSNVSAIMRAHQPQLLGITPLTIPVTSAPADLSIASTVSMSKPRPPCIIIVGN